MLALNESFKFTVAPDYLNQFAMAHLSGAWAMHRAVSRGEGYSHVMAAVAQWGMSKDANIGAPLHGAVWEAIRLHPARGLWDFILRQLCNFHKQSTAVSWACVHGTGHGMLLHAMWHQAPDIARAYGTCTVVAPGARGYLNDKTLETALIMCSEAPSTQHAFLCAQGVYCGHTLTTHPFMGTRIWEMLIPVETLGSAPLDPNDSFRIDILAPCASTARFPAACFDFGVPYHATLYHPGAINAEVCIAQPMRAELNRRGCIFALSKWQHVWQHVTIEHVTISQADDINQMTSTPRLLGLVCSRWLRDLSDVTWRMRQPDRTTGLVVSGSNYRQ